MNSDRPIVAGLPPSPLPSPDELITMQTAAALCGLSPKTLRTYVHQGRLQTELVTPRLRMTTRRWLHAMLKSRGTRKGPGAPPRPLPSGYEPPGPGRPKHPRLQIVHAGRAG